MQELMEYEGLLEDIEKSGIGRVSYLDNELKINMCMADHDGAEVILPDGQIGKCEHFSDSELVGSIYNENQDIAMIDSWKELVPKSPACDDCPIYPICKRLKKCVYVDGECKPSYRMQQERTLKRQMIAEYNRYKEGKNNES